jgi:glycosyltransferase involved in cell wall biosynthesis
VINPSLDLGKSFHRDALFIIIARFLNKKPIVFFHGWFDPYEEKIKKSKWEQFVFKLSYAKVKNYIVLGSTFKNKLQQLGVAPDATFNIETMVADSTWLKQLNICSKLQSFEKAISILFLSRIEKEKGLFITIDSFQRFVETQADKNIKLIIAGDGPDLEAAKKYVNKKSIVNVKFLGHVSGNDKMKVLLESHVLMLPSYTEGLPNVILEGMLYGMPVVARATGGIPEIVKQGINGYVSESFDPEIFAGYLTTLCSDINLYKTISERNHLIAKENYTSEKVRERVLRIIEN